MSWSVSQRWLARRQHLKPRFISEEACQVVGSARHKRRQPNSHSRESGRGQRSDESLRGRFPRRTFHIFGRKRNRLKPCRRRKLNSWHAGSWRKAMAPPSLNIPELEVLIGIFGVLIFVGSFLALLFSAIFGLGLAQLFYVGGRWCVRKVHQTYSLSGAPTINAIGRISPHH
jgi:hypothetical protein